MDLVDLGGVISQSLSEIASREEWSDKKIFIKYGGLTHNLSNGRLSSSVHFEKLVKVDLTYFEMYSDIYPRYSNPKVTDIHVHFIECIHRLLYDWMYHEEDYKHLMDSPVIHYQRDSLIVPLILCDKYL